MAKKKKHSKGNGIGKSQFLSQAKYTQTQINNIIPKAYAALALSIFASLDEPDDVKQDWISDVFGLSQEIWFRCADEGLDICKECLDKTGIDVIRSTTSMEE